MVKLPLKNKKNKKNKSSKKGVVAKWGKLSRHHKLTAVILMVVIVSLIAFLGVKYTNQSHAASITGYAREYIYLWRSAPVHRCASTSCRQIGTLDGGYNHLMCFQSKGENLSAYGYNNDWWMYSQQDHGFVNEIYASNPTSPIDRYFLLTYPFWISIDTASSIC
jgi:hypothetical protein